MTSITSVDDCEVAFYYDHLFATEGRVNNYIPLHYAALFHVIIMIFQDFQRLYIGTYLSKELQSYFDNEGDLMSASVLPR